MTRVVAHHSAIPKRGRPDELSAMMADFASGIRTERNPTRQCGLSAPDEIATPHTGRGRNRNAPEIVSI